MDRDRQTPQPLTEWDRIKNGIFAGESGGDYNALFGYSNRPGGQFSQRPLTSMTVNEALEFSNPSGPYGQWVKGQVGRVATPMGAFQVVGTTLRSAMKGLGLTGNEVMTPVLQDQIGRWIYEQQGTAAWEGYRGPLDSYTPSNGTAYASGGAPDAQPGNALAGSPGQPAQNALAMPQFIDMRQDVTPFLRPRNALAIG